MLAIPRNDRNLVVINERWPTIVVASDANESIRFHHNTVCFMICFSIGQKNRNIANENGSIDA